MITPLSEALAERGFDTLTPVQEAVSDPELAASDLLVSAQTGSGKTVGFGLAIAPTLLGDEDRFGRAAAPLALVVAPTRELAFQVMRELSWLYARTGAVVTSCVGGMDMRQERRALERGAHIVVGTPGRLRDHIERHALDLSDLRAVVLDEADEMLDLGFREDLEFMLGEAPETRRTLLFSATVPPMIATLAQKYQRDARRVSTIGKNDQHSDIAYQAIRVAPSDTEHAIFNLLRFHEDQSAIVFGNTRAAVNHLTARLANRGLATVSLSGELSQNERTHALQAMRDGRARICVATDVAARGIDLPNLNLVIHAELPTNAESLLHRSGRTGRAGKKGISVLIVPPKAVKRTERLLKWAKISADWTTAPSVEDIQRQDEARLLADPVWQTPISDEHAAFASKLLALHSPEVIAAAYLRLYQARHAAPEELLPPDTKPAAREHREFGPSRWVSLSVGRIDRAEPRWILPLLCRAGNLDKSAIGAIRVQQGETFVELAEPSLDGFLNALGPDGLLEEGIVARPLEGAPDLQPQGRAPRPESRSGPRPGPRSGPRSDPGADAGEQVARETGAHAPDAGSVTAPEAAETPVAVSNVADTSGPAKAGVAYKDTVREAAPEMRKPRHKARSNGPASGPAQTGASADRPGATEAKAFGAGVRGPAPKAAKTREQTSNGPTSKGTFSKGGEPKGAGHKAAGKGPSRKGATSAGPKRAGPKAAGAPAKAYAGKSGGKPYAGKPSGKPHAGKPGTKPGAKPAGKFGGSSDARDSSKRYTPPGQKPAAPRIRKADGQGHDAPRRSKP